MIWRRHAATIGLSAGSVRPVNGAVMAAASLPMAVEPIAGVRVRSPRHGWAGESAVRRRHWIRAILAGGVLLAASVGCTMTSCPAGTRAGESGQCVCDGRTCSGCCTYGGPELAIPICLTGTDDRACGEGGASCFECRSEELCSPQFFRGQLGGACTRACHHRACRGCCFRKKPSGPEACGRFVGQEDTDQTCGPGCESCGPDRTCRSGRCVPRG